MAKNDIAGEERFDMPFDQRFVPIGAAAKIGPRQIALVPGAAVPTLRFDLPAGVTGHAREQIARRQLQDKVGASDEGVDMRPLSAAPGWRTALISAPAQTEIWRGQAGRARGLLPDYLALPTSTGLWTVARTGQHVCVRWGPEDGFAGHAALALAEIDQRLAGDGARPKVILQLGGPLEGLAERAADLGIPIVSRVQDVAQAGGIDAPKVLGHGELGCDLLRDPALTRVRLRRAVRAWMLPLVLAAVTAGLWAAADRAETRRLVAERQEIARATNGIVRARFVPEGPILDVRAQVTQALARVNAAPAPGEPGATALDLFMQASPVIDASGSTLKRVSSADGQRLALEVHVDDFAAADALRDALAAGAMSASLIEARVTEQGGGVRATLELTAGGAHERAD